MAAAPTKIGILSIGDMGMGIAKLLRASGFAVATNCKGRSEDTIERAKDAGVELLASDVELTDSCAVILSVVPPRDTLATAERVVEALVGVTQRDQPLYFVDLNAVAPSTVRSIAGRVDKARVPVRFVDGCILGGPPALQPAASSSAASSSSSSAAAAAAESRWVKPSLPASGPHKLSDVPVWGESLSSALNMRHISPDIGAASGLKMCYASLTKGFTALAIQSFTTARRLGVLDDLKQEMQPASWERAEKGVTAMPPKAYRWVREMEEIALAFEEDGGFAQSSFQGAARVFQAVADSELGQEKIGKRKRGTTVEDMTAVLAEGMDKRKKKNV